MSYINMTPNIQDMFATINDRLRKLETGPSGPQDTADAAQGTAVQATVLATQATTAANLANTQATTAIALAGTKNTVFYSGSAPTANAVNDQWIDTAHGNLLKIWDGTNWVSVQDTAIQAAQSASVAAQTTANGKNAIYRQGTTPTTPYTGTQFITGDMWFNTSSDNAISYWTGSAWSSTALGNSALYGNISANKLTSGSIDASVINVSNINAGNISTGTLAASRIATGSLDASKITSGTITASQIASGTITATQIAAGTITATQISSSYVYAGSIQATQIYAGTLTGFTIDNGSGTFHVNSSGYVTATSGQVGGWNLGVDRFYASGSTYLQATTGDIATVGNITSGGNISTAFGNISSGGLLSGNTVQVNSGGAFNSYGSNRFDGVMYYGDGVIYSHPTTSASANVYVNPSAGSNYGTFARSTSSQKYKLEIQEQSIPLDSILTLTPKSYVDKAQAEEKGSTEGLQRYLGLIAEDVTLIPVLGSMLANLDSEGNPDSVNYDRVAVALIPLLKDHETRLAKLEGK